ncbi:FAD/NAD(P)-binding domain-containing protein [Laetiporus sulphureus 93-53]|uniref:FAD/NAD(P)-binding domain-containing protein n=1 Tax=Laetiporus sulphureus 93-53 TaxID=1314785 RepID=A0A165CC71_9APHY|nr:FAD/NAD(P)-binding domain-containing protein [Laetiporus sulphureus 93-53]KZT02548.1 FAD/NAD(P)-binding domain-containing protein [Laetiporus sulphureus 93-53]
MIKNYCVGIAGLAAAVALTRVGHRVQVLEKSDGTKNRGGGGVRMPPNMSKILFHWGLKEKLRKIALTSQPILFSRFESGELLGTQVWDNELLRETRGEFMLTTHSDLHRVLLETALSQGATIRTNADVVEIHPDKREVKLASGEVLTADVIIGADGENGLARRIVIGRQDHGTPVGLTMFEYVTFFTCTYFHLMLWLCSATFNTATNMVFIAFGNGCCAVGYPIHAHQEIAFHFLLRDDRTDGAWGDPPSADLKRLVPSPCDARLRIVADNASNAVRVAVKDYGDLEEWVHESNTMVLVGQAAHPFPPASLQGTAMAVEDAAVLAKLFAHLSSPEEIGSFLWAFQDLRHKRCNEAREAEMSSMFWMTLENGEAQSSRDNGMREKFRAGKNVMEGEDGEDDSPQWQELRNTFGYDCEDEADNWWVQWGVLRERARGGSNASVQTPGDGGFDWSTMSIQVNESTAAATAVDQSV